MSTAHGDDQRRDEWQWDERQQAASYPMPAPPEPSGYAAPPPYPGNPYYPAPYALPQNEPLAIASLVLSLVGLVTCGVTGIIGAILGHKARKKIREHTPQLAGDGLAQAGIVVGWVLGGLGIAYWLFVMVLVSLSITGVIE